MSLSMKDAEVWADFAENMDRIFSEADRTPRVERPIPAPAMVYPFGIGQVVKHRFTGAVLCITNSGFRNKMVYASDEAGKSRAYRISDLAPYEGEK